MSDGCQLIKKDNLGKCGTWWSYWSPTPSPSCPIKPKKKRFWHSHCPLPPLERHVSEVCPFKPFFQIGLIWIEFLRRFLFSSAACTSVVYAKENTVKDSKQKSSDENCVDKRITSRDLPLYIDEPPCFKCEDPKDESILLLSTIKTVRREVWNLMGQIEIVKREASTLILRAKHRMEDEIDFLREESNLAPRAGAIAVAGLSGYILALRKGKMKRMMYTLGGGTAMAALCYPREAKEYSEIALGSMKKYFIIFYHLFNGVSRDLFGYELPSLPGKHHLHVSDNKRDEDAVPPPEQLLPPVATPTHLHVQPGKKPVVD